MWRRAVHHFANYSLSEAMSVSSSSSALFVDVESASTWCHSPSGEASPCSTLFSISVAPVKELRGDTPPPEKHMLTTVVRTQHFDISEDDDVEAEEEYFPASLRSSCDDEMQQVQCETHQRQGQDHEDAWKTCYGCHSVDAFKEKESAKSNDLTSVAGASNCFDWHHALEVLDGDTPGLSLQAVDLAAVPLSELLATTSSSTEYQDLTPSSDCSHELPAFAPPSRPMVMQPQPPSKPHKMASLPSPWPLLAASSSTACGLPNKCCLDKIEHTPVMGLQAC